VAASLKRQPVLIHCPTGGDGSAVLSSLAQIIIDPFYRTFEGLRSLILKDWVYIQHDFLRKQALTLDIKSGEIIDSIDGKKQQEVIKAWPNVNNCTEYAPFFILFLDCIN